MAASLGIDPLPAAVQDRERVHDMAETINHRHRMAQLVSRASSELFTLLYFSGKNVEEEAMVVAVKANGIRVMVPRFGIESGITLWQETSFDEEKSGAVDKATAAAAKNPWKLDEQAMTLAGPGGVCYRIFEQVRVRIFVQEAKSRRKWLQIELLDKVAASKPTQQIVDHLATATATKPAAAAPAAASASSEPAAAAAAATPAAKKVGKKRDIVHVNDDDDDAEVEEVPAAKKSTKAAASAAKKKQKL